MPGFERLAQLQPHATVGNLPVKRKTKLTLGVKPLRIEAIALAPQVLQHVEEILPHEMLQHEPVVKRSTPAHHGAVKGLAPMPSDDSAQQQLLGETHACIGRHFERAEFDEAEPAGAA